MLLDKQIYYILYNILFCWIGSKLYLTWLFFLEDKLKPYKYIKKTGGLVLGLWCSAHHLLHPKAFVVKIVKTVMAFPVLGTNRSKIVLNFKYILTIWHYSEDWRENLVNFCTTYFFLPQNQGSKYNYWIKSAINKQTDEIYF